jgi:colicin import membrane protein
MRTGLTISGVGHAAVLLWSVLTFVVRPYHAESQESLPVDIISATEFSQITSGAKNAPQVKQPAPLVEKIAPAQAPDDPLAKLGKTEIKAATDVSAPPPEIKPPTPPKKVATAAPDQIADALKKDPDKKPVPKKADIKPPTPPKKPVQQQPQPPAFDARQVAALLDKRDPQRTDATGETLNTNVSLGLPKGTAALLSQNELDALRQRLADLWSPPAGAKDPQELTVEVEIKLKADGTLEGPPIVLTSGRTPLFMAARDSAMRAVFRGQPYTMLRPEHYDQWKDVVITFDPRYMMRN